MAARADGPRPAVSDPPDLLQVVAAALAALALAAVACDDSPLYVADVPLSREETRALEVCRQRPGLGRAISGVCPTPGSFSSPITCKEAVANCFINFRSNRPRDYVCFWNAERTFVFEAMPGLCPTSPPASSAAPDAGR